MNEDSTATAHGASPIAQERDVGKVDLDHLAIYVADLIRRGLLIEAWGEVDRAVFLYDFDEPRGLSASEGPTSPEAVIPISIQGAET